MTWSSSSGRRRAAWAPAGGGARPAADHWAELQEPAQVDAERARLAAEKAEAEAEAGRKRELDQAYRKGLDEGRRAGEERARLELAAAVQAARAALDGLAEVEERHAGALRENLTALAVAVARRIVDRELETHPETVSTLVQGAVAAFPPDQGLKIRVHPQDLSYIAAAELSEDGLPALTNREVRWIPDEAVVHGGCVVEGPERVVDGRVDRALERIYWALNDA